MKSNLQYWKARAKARVEDYTADADKISAELGKAYYAAERMLKEESRNVFKGFQNAFKLSKSEAKRLVGNTNVALPSKAVKSIIDGLSDPEIKNQLLAYLSAPAYQYRMKRLDNLAKSADKICKQLYTTELRTDTAYFATEIDKAYKHLIFDIQQGTGAYGAFNQIPQSRIQEILKYDWSGEHYSKRIWGNTQDLAETLKQNMIESFLTGESEQGAAARIQQRFKVGFNEARRLIRTDNTFITNQAELEGYNEAEIEEYTYMAVMDNDTSDECKALNGKSFKVKNAKPGVNLPPMHPWCRSTTIGKLPSEEELDAMWDKDMAEYVPEGLTFDEWLDGLQPTEDGKLVYTGKSGKSVDKLGRNDIIDLYKGKGIDIIPNAEISEDIISRVEQATKQITSDFKVLENYSEPISFADVIGGYAENHYSVFTGKNQITLDKSVFSDSEKLLDLLKIDFRTGKSYDTDYIESLIAHEMGHNAHITLALKRSDLPYGKPLTVIEQAIFHEKYDKISQEIYETAFKSETYDEIQKMCAEQLGTMTFNSPKELIAQSFGNYYYGKNKSEIAKKIVKYFMKGLR